MAPKGSETHNNRVMHRSKKAANRGGTACTMGTECARRTDAVFSKISR
jgi:hypothetical protein